MQNPPPPPPPPPPPGDFPPPPPPPGGYPLASTPSYPAQPGHGYTPQVGYGGFWIRFVAYIIDSIIVGVPSGIVAVIVGAITGVAGGGLSSSTSTNQNAAVAIGALLVVLVLDLIILVVTIGYFVYFWSIGSTLGMRLFKLRVADANTGQPIGVPRALLRFLGFFIASLPCDIGLIWAAFDGRKQGWHDKIAGTVVLQG